MTRKEFIKISGILGLNISCGVALGSCTKEVSMESDFNGKVVIIGAGAGGMSAGYLLQQQGIDFEILEASSIYGGRMRINTDFADFPIPLGAEWLETDTGIFQRIVNDSSIEVNVETIPDEPDRKFVNSSWLNFFEEHIVPSISEKMVYNTIVDTIDYSEGQIVIKTDDNQYVADRVIVSVPLKVLQDKDISFIPDLPDDKQKAINETIIWEGFKAFIEFSENFHNGGHQFQITPNTDGQKIYYDATLGQNTTKIILGLFVIGTPAQDYISLSGDELRDFILRELDEIYSNQATPSYVKHITQNWNKEPFIKAGYMTDHADSNTVKKLSESVSDKIFFAGGAYTDGEDWVSVHTAAQSAKEAIVELVS